MCKRPFAEFVERNRIRYKRSLQDFYQRREQDWSRPAAFKNPTVRERPQQVTLGNVTLQAERVKQRLLRHRLSHHQQPPATAGMLNQIIAPPSTPSFSTASTVSSTDRCNTF
jgi:hypothetical protein